MTEIIVRKDFTVRDIEQARLKRAATRRNPATSNASHVLNLADLRKAIVMCPTDAKKFDARRYGYYRQREYPYVMGNCDCCKVFGKSALFIHEDTVKNVWVTREQDRRNREYATVVAS